MNFIIIVIIIINIIIIIIIIVIIITVKCFTLTSAGASGLSSTQSIELRPSPSEP